MIMTGAKVCSKLEGFSRRFPNLTFHSKPNCLRYNNIISHSKLKTKTVKIITETFAFFYLSVFVPNPYLFLKPSINAIPDNFCFYSNLIHESERVCSNVNEVLEVKYRELFSR